MPVRENPPGPHTSTKRWDQERYAAFAARIHTLRERMDTAFNTEDTEASLVA